MITNMKYILALILTFSMIVVRTGAPSQKNDFLKTKKLSTFNTVINDAPSPEYKRAIEHCTSTMETNWVSNITTVVRFDFEPFSSTDLLAAARPSGSIELGKQFFPLALAKSITGINIGSYDRGRFDADVEVNINTKAKWYTGVDGNTPSGQRDLVKICMHELMHGLVFSGRTESIFKYRFGAFLTTKTEDGDYCALKSFESQPKMLKRALTNNELYFGANNRTIAKLYAPPKFAEASSIFHLDSDTYKNGPDSLMIPSDMAGESQHNIGPVTKRIEATLRDQTAMPLKQCAAGANPVKNTKLGYSSMGLIAGPIGGAVVLSAIIFGTLFRWRRTRS